MMALKVDMAKVYDRLEWPFIRDSLLATGFSDNITSLILFCVSSVSYQVLINGQPSKRFILERGIRQDDPISPYLFILYANVLSEMLHKESHLGKLHGIKVARNAPQITHLLLDDDNLLFARANEKEAETLIQVLHSYQLAFGQLVNFDKSDMSYGRNVPIHDKEIICNKIGMKVVIHHSKYLGLPIVFGIKTLIKSVAQAIPNYVLSCFKIP